MNSCDVITEVTISRAGEQRVVNLRAHLIQLRADAAAIAVQETVPFEESAVLAVFAGLTGRASA